VDPDSLIEKYRKKGVVLDTNLLVLLAIGTYNRSRIATFKRTRSYTDDDFELLLILLAAFERRVTTPNILTEADNLARQMPAVEHPALAATMRAIVEQFFEQYCASSEVVRSDQFARLGLADCVTASLAQDVLVLTDDFRLSSLLASMGRDAININHIRTLNWT
jgi:hypothetical protein